MAHPPDRAGWYAQASAGAAHDAFARLGDIRAPTLVVHGTADNVVDAAQRAADRRRDPGRAARALRGRRPPAPVGAAGRVRRARRGVPRDERCTRSTTGSATRARRTPQRVAIDYLGREVTYARARRALRRARGRVARARPATRRPRRDADRQHAGARDRLLRLREGRLHPAAAELAARRARAPLPARRRRAVGASRRAPSTRSSPTATGHEFEPLAPPDGEDAAPVTARGRRRRPAAPDLHVRHDGQAEGRAPHARELLLDEPQLRPRDRPDGRRRRAAAAAAVPLRRLERAVAARLVEGREGSCSSARSSRRASSRCSRRSA